MLQSSYMVNTEGHLVVFEQLLLRYVLSWTVFWQCNSSIAIRHSYLPPNSRVVSTVCVSWVVPFTVALRTKSAYALAQPTNLTISRHGTIFSFRLNIPLCTEIGLPWQLQRHWCCTYKVKVRHLVVNWYSIQPVQFETGWKLGLSGKFISRH